MQLIIAAVGHKMPVWITQGFEEYAKRMPPELRILLKEIKPIERSASKTAATAMALERERIEAVVPKGARRIALDELGVRVTTHQLAERLLAWQREGRDAALLVGGPDGLDTALKANCDESLRLSDLTLPHAFVRVLVAEALYRAWSVTANHPYHRE